MFKVLVEGRAKADIQKGIDYYDEINKELGLKFEKAVDKEITGLKKHALYQIKYKNIRCKLIKNFPYLLHFTINETEKIVLVYALINTSKNPDKNWL